MLDKNNLEKIKEVLKNKKCLALLAPSFVTQFNFLSIIDELKKLGFDKVVELTFGAKMINREYHKILKEKNKLWISTTCPGICDFIKNNYPQLVKNLIPVDSPMIATAKICKKIYPKHKTIFISPCNFKKQEAENSKHVDYVIDFQQLKQLFIKNKIKIKPSNRKKIQNFNSFYNDYTKIYPIAGGLSKTAHLKGILSNDEVKIIDGIAKVKIFLDNYLKNPSDKIKFLDINFCNGGCLGGPFIQKGTLAERKNKLKKYMDYAQKTRIPKKRKGWIKKAEGINFRK